MVGNRAGRGGSLSSTGCGRKRAHLRLQPHHPGQWSPYRSTQKSGGDRWSGSCDASESYA